ncbi:MAG TPA: DUF2069 domain-containing protein [Gammaproteobacteria bacterium]|jgi:uncharacterized membrane protein|nr:DUF2069 domain-containing protein [Gammaproteobacteria bacterium]HET7587270.1 DUF2069 domain-containing protein [Gammaproteobacteria bacterium]
MIAPRKLTLAAAGALALWLLTWFGWLSPPHSFPMAAAMTIAVLPLLIVGWPLIRDRVSAYAWCGFIALGYMAHALTEIFAGATDQWLAIVELVLVAILFVASGAALRVRRAQVVHEAD